VSTGLQDFAFLRRHICLKEHGWTVDNIQALKYRSVTDIVRPIREIVRRRKETTDQSETEVYCLSDPSVLVSDRTV
jgi:hypothetical protein